MKKYQAQILILSAIILSASFLLGIWISTLTLPQLVAIRNYQDSAKALTLLDSEFENQMNWFITKILRSQTNLSNLQNQSPHGEINCPTVYSKDDNEEPRRSQRRSQRQREHREREHRERQREHRRGPNGICKISKDMETKVNMRELQVQGQQKGIIFDISSRVRSSYRAYEIIYSFR